jgi:hypothetical protein
LIRQVREAIIGAARALKAEWRISLIAFALYAALLAALYLFFTTREATMAQLLLTLLLAISAVALFFSLGALGLREAHNRGNRGNGGNGGNGGNRVVIPHLREALNGCWKLLLVSLPVLLVGWLVAAGISWIEFKATGGREWEHGVVPDVIAPGLRYLLLLFALPLIAIRLWIVTLGEGVGAALRGSGRSIVRALGPRPLLVYLLLAVVSGLLIYLLLSIRTPASNAWIEITLLGARIALAALVAFIAWMIALGALARVRDDSSRWDRGHPARTKQANQVPG